VLIEIDGERCELDWRGVAVLLALRWTRFRALPLTRLKRVEADPGRLASLIDDLASKGLVERATVGRSVIVLLTERGERAARALEEMARKAGILPTG